jgi:hypothetical protein
MSAEQPRTSVYFLIKLLDHEQTLTSNGNESFKFCTQFFLVRGRTHLLRKWKKSKLIAEKV